MGQAGSAQFVRGPIPVALIFREGAGSATGRGLTHLAPTWFVQALRNNSPQRLRCGPAAFPVQCFAIAQARRLWP